MDEKILRCINRISPHACDYVKGAMKDGNVEIIHGDFEHEREGVFLVARGENCDIFYASFYGCTVDKELMDKIREKTIEYLNNVQKKEVCFNVYGENENIIRAVRELGFQSDMKGYHMEYLGSEMEIAKDVNLGVREFHEDMIDEIATLMDNAYYQLNMDNGWNLKYHRENKESLLKELMDLKKDDGVKIFFFEDTMVGAYLCVGDYIGDLVVHPDFQGRGFGRGIIAHCIRHMRETRGSKVVRLRVAESNKGAKRLYEKLGFKDIAYFAEHTLKK